ncbi:MAG: response regulator transcription factor [Chloroflexota bacterium]
MFTTLVIGSNSDLLNKGMTHTLEQHGNYVVVGIAQSATDLLDYVQTAQPAVTIIEDGLYDRHILDLLHFVTHACPTTKIIVLGALADGLLVRDLFHAGANGYLYKSDRLCECLTFAVATVLRDRKYLSPTANAEYLVAMQSPQRDWHLDHEARTVLQMLAQGKRAYEIARDLDVDTKRVYFVRQKLRKRFGAETNEHLISVAATEGFIYP